jgi:pimeloyl-ACP methyl ester carboxylesterase
VPLLDLPGRGVRLAVTDHAPGRTDLRPLVLAHATGFCGGVWKPIAAVLAGRYRVISFDQRGHGDSDKPPDDYAWQNFVADLAALLERLELRDVVAVGHSKGGAAVAGAVAEFPGRISRAVLLDPVLVPRLPSGQDRPSSNALAEGARRRRMVWSSRAEMLESFAVRMPFAAWRRDVLEAYVECGTTDRAEGGIVLKCPGEIEARVYEGGARSASLEYLPRATVPTLLVAGGESSTLPLELARHAVEQLPDGRLIVLAGVGHFVPMERPDEVVRLIDEFVAS